MLLLDPKSVVEMHAEVTLVLSSVKLATFVRSWPKSPADAERRVKRSEKTLVVGGETLLPCPLLLPLLEISNDDWDTLRMLTCCTVGVLSTESVKAALFSFRDLISEAGNGTFAADTGRGCGWFKSE